MKRWMRWGIGGVVALGLLAGGAVALGSHLAQRKQQRLLKIDVDRVAVPDDAASLARGKYLFESRGCTECHGSAGAGRMFVNEGGMKLAGPNITSGGVTGDYRVVDWVRVIRHGVKRNQNPAFIMPSEDYNRLTDEDLGALIAYLDKLPPQTGGPAVVQLPLPVRVLYGFGVIQDAAEKIDHSLPPARPVEAAVSVEHGAYVANMCIGCHGARLSGGKIPGGPPDWPAAANLTPGEGSAMTRYAQADAFVAMLRSGKRSDGSAVQVMPFDSIGKLNDTDARALHAYLLTLPARPAGGR